MANTTITPASNPPGITSIIYPVLPLAVRTAPDDRSSQPRYCSRPNAPTTSTAVHRNTRRAAAQSPDTETDPAEPYPAEPYPAEPSRKRLRSGTVSQGPHPGTTGPSTIQHLNIRPDRVVLAPQSMLNLPVNTKHPTEDFSNLLRRSYITSIHSNELLVSAIREIDNLNFKRKKNYYSTDWIECDCHCPTSHNSKKKHKTHPPCPTIGVCFRIVMLALLLESGS